MALASELTSAIIFVVESEAVGSSVSVYCQHLASVQISVVATVRCITTVHVMPVCSVNVDSSVCGNIKSLAEVALLGSYVSP